MPATELLGLLAAVVILLLAFGSVIAMGLPIVTAIAGILVSLTAVTHLVRVRQHTRLHRSGRRDDRHRRRHRLRAPHRHPPPRGAARGAQRACDAIDEAMRTAGRSVVFAGVTVMISLLGLLLVRLELPHGSRVRHGDRGRRRSRSPRSRCCPRCSRSSAPASTGCTSAARTRSRQADAQRAVEPCGEPPSGARARCSAAACSSPSLCPRSACASRSPTRATTPSAPRPARPTTGSPTASVPASTVRSFVVVDTPTDAARGWCPTIVEQVAATPGIVFVEPRESSPDGGISTFTAFPTTAPQSAATEHLVHDLRHDLPDNVHIGGADRGQHRLLDASSPAGCRGSSAVCSC